MEALPHKLRIVYFGSGAFGLPTLRHLAAQHSIVAIVTQPDRPAGRGGQPTPTAVGAWIADGPALRDTPVYKPERIATPETIDAIRAHNADAWVVIAYGQKLPPSLLSDRFAINLHASLLPRWRGAAPIHAAMLAGDPETGNSVITLADKMDAGLILAQSRRTISAHVTVGELHDLLAQDGPSLVQQVLDAHRENALTPRAQDRSLVTIAPKLTKADGWIDFHATAEACRRRIHALTPWPGVAVTFRGQPLKLLRAQDIDRSNETPPAPKRNDATGRFDDPEQGIVRCGHVTQLRLLEVQPAGRKAMDWPDFARGSRPTAADQLVSIAAIPASSTRPAS